MCDLADTAICICVQREVNIAVQKEEGVVISRYVCWYLIFAKRSGFSLRLTWRWATPSMWLLSSQILHVRFQPDKERLVGLCALLQYDRSFCLMEKANWMQSYVRKTFLFCTNTLGSCVPCASPSKHAGLGRLRFLIKTPGNMRGSKTRKTRVFSCRRPSKDMRNGTVLNFL